MPEEHIRLILDGGRSAIENMAIDEAMLESRNDLGMSTLRLYTWEPSAVSLGYFQSLDNVLDLEFLETRGIDYIRRVTGGGTVYHDRKGEVTYSMVVTEREKYIPYEIVDSYRFLTAGIIKGIEKLGLRPEFAPINDIVLNGRKISGNAQTRRHGNILQHGTIICDVDPETMFSALKISDEKTKDKLISSIYDRVTSLKNEGLDLSLEEVKLALAEGYAEALPLPLKKGQLTPEEQEKAIELQEKYKSREWNHKR